MKDAFPGEIPTQRGELDDEDAAGNDRRQRKEPGQSALLVLHVSHETTFLRIFPPVPSRRVR